MENGQHTVCVQLAAEAVLQKDGERVMEKSKLIMFIAIPSLAQQQQQRRLLLKLLRLLLQVSFLKCMGYRTLSCPFDNSPNFS